MNQHIQPATQELPEKKSGIPAALACKCPRCRSGNMFAEKIHTALRPP